MTRRPPRAHLRRPAPPPSASGTTEPATASGTVTSGNASVNYSLPAGTPAGSYTINASYSGATGFASSSGTATLTITPKALTITAKDESKTYGAVFTPNGATQFTTN